MGEFEDMNLDYPNTSRCSLYDILILFVFYDTGKNSFTSNFARLIEGGGPIMRFVVMSV